MKPENIVRFSKENRAMYKYIDLTVEVYEEYFEISFSGDGVLLNSIGGDAHMMSSLMGGGGWGVGGLASVLDVQSLFFYQRKLDLGDDKTSC